MALPRQEDLYNPLLKALHALGGSATIREMDEKVAEITGLSDKQLNVIHKGNVTEFSYLMGWARNNLKRYGLLENSSRGVWALTNKGNSVKSVDKELVKRGIDTRRKKIINDLTEDEVEAWQNELLDFLKKLSPGEFEKLCQRILRESGFVQVNVTGKSGDGGIDGKGVVKIGGFLSFRVIFQCKRYKGRVSSQEIREFKGTMSGRADKGLFITTGTYTREARVEAERDGSITIDLIDGQELVSKMKELGLGIKIRTEEIIEIDHDWFKNF